MSIYTNELILNSINKFLLEENIPNVIQLNNTTSSLIYNKYARIAMITLMKLDLSNNATIVFDIDDTLIFSKTGYPIKPIIDLYNFCILLGLKIIIITNRVETNENIEHTKNQLKNVGISIYDLIYFRPSFFEPSKFKVVARKNVVDLGYNIIMSIGDMYWDLGEYGGIGIKLPNVI
jgi:predicted secreted acid phosphatase